MASEGCYIVYEGYLEKKSKWLHSWRNRWTVLTSNLQLSTYKDHNKQNLTDSIDLTNYMNIIKILNVNSDDTDDNQWNVLELISCTDFKYEFRTSDLGDFYEWYKQICNAFIRNDIKTRSKLKSHVKETSVHYLINAYFRHDNAYQYIQAIPPTIKDLICLYYYGSYAQIWILYVDENMDSNTEDTYTYDATFDDNHDESNMDDDAIRNNSYDNTIGLSTDTKCPLKMIEPVFGTKHDVKLKHVKYDYFDSESKWEDVECGVVSQHVSLPQSFRNNRQFGRNCYNVIPYSHPDMHGLMFFNTMNIDDLCFIKLPHNDVVKYSSFKIYNEYSSKVYFITETQIVSYDLNKLKKFESECLLSNHLPLQISACWMNEQQNKLLITNMIEKGDDDTMDKPLNNYSSNLHLFLLDLKENDINYMKLPNMNYSRISPGCCYLNELNKFVVGGNENHSYGEWSSVVEFYDAFKNKWITCQYRCGYRYEKGCHMISEPNNPNVIYIYDEKHIEWLDQRTDDLWTSIEIDGDDTQNQHLKSLFLC